MDTSYFLLESPFYVLGLVVLSKGSACGREGKGVKVGGRGVIRRLKGVTTTKGGVSSWGNSEVETAEGGVAAGRVHLTGQNVTSRAQQFHKRCFFGRTAG